MLKNLHMLGQRPNPHSCFALPPLIPLPLHRSTPLLISQCLGSLDSSFNILRDIIFCLLILPIYKT